MKATKNCVKCLKRRASSWTGYVVDGADEILAGWCRYCVRFRGFSGHFKRKMGRSQGGVYDGL